ncbi:hypothetical protein MASR2M15_14770 [Anaerolineales bacterium]
MKNYITLKDTLQRLTIIFENGEANREDKLIYNDAIRSELIELIDSRSEDLIFILQTYDDAFGVKLARSLCEIEAPGIGIVLGQVIRSANILVAMIAIEYLIHNPTQYVELLIEDLYHVSPMVQIQLIRALGFCEENTQAVEAIMRFLEKEAHSSSALKYTCIQALGHLKDKRAIALIERYLTDENHHVQEYAIKALEILRA